jgi:hypothetical protein
MRVMQRRWIARKATRPAEGVPRIPVGKNGAPLAAGVKDEMEQQLGTDLSGVRVHTDGDSAQAADRLGARAFTVDNDLHFNRGQFAPGSREGDKLLAHELTHVVQGRGGRKAESSSGRMDVSQPGEPAELEADSVADRVTDKMYGGPSARGPLEVGSVSSGVSRKVYRETEEGDGEGPQEAQAAPEAAGPGGPQAGGPEGGGPEGGGPGGEAQVDPAEQQAQQECTQSAAACAGDATDSGVWARLKIRLPQVQQYAQQYQGNNDIQQALATMQQQQQQVDDACTTALTAAVDAINNIDQASPGSWSAEGAVWGEPKLQSWMSNFGDKPEVQNVRAAHDGKQEQIKTARDTACNTAREQIAGVQAEDPQAAETVDKAYNEAQPWLGQGIFNNAAEQQLTQAYRDKKSAIEEAAAKPKPQPDPAQGGDAAQPATGGGDAAPQQNEQPAQSATPQQNEAPAPEQNTAPQQNEAPAPEQNTAPQQNEAPAPEQNAAPQQTEAPAPEQNTAPQQNEAPAPEQPAPTQGAQTQPDPAPAQEAGAEGQQTGEPPKAQEAEDPKAEELRLKKEAAKAQLVTYLAECTRVSKAGGAFVETLNTALTVLQALGQAKGMPIPSEAVTAAKDALTFGVKYLDYEKVRDHILAVVGVEAASSIDEIDTLFGAADMLKDQHQGILGFFSMKKEEAMQKIAAPDGKQKVAELAEQPAPEEPAAQAPQQEGDQSLASKAEKTVTGTQAALDQAQEDPAVKQALSAYSNVLDPLAWFASILETKGAFEALRAAAVKQKEAEDAVAAYVAEHGGKPLPGAPPPT